MTNKRDELKVVFISVGTTSFDPLINEAITFSFARTISTRFDSRRIVLQIGRGRFTPPSYAVNVKETSRDASTGLVTSWSFYIPVSREVDEDEVDVEEEEDEEEEEEDDSINKSKKDKAAEKDKEVSINKSSSSSLTTTKRRRMMTKKRKRDTSSISSTTTLVFYEVYRFKPSLAADFESSSLVVSHAGAGSVFEALRAKKPLLVVVNPILADNHQTELADALSCVEGTGHGPHLTWCMADQVSKVLSTFDFKTLKPLPRSDLTKFTTTLDRILR